MLMLAIVNRVLGHLIQAICMYLLWGKLSSSIWWTLFITLIIFYFAGKTYYTAVADGESPAVIRFWNIVRSVIFILDIVIIIGMIWYLVAH
jgi:hypothetical protein